MSMVSTGVLVLTSPLHTLPFRLAPVLKSASQLVERTLYVHLHPGLNLCTGSPPRPVFVPPSVDLPGLISRLYSNAADICAHLDVRLLLTNISAQQCELNFEPFPSPQTLSQSPEVVMTDFPLKDLGQMSLVARCLEVYAGSCYVCAPSISSVVLSSQMEEAKQEQERKVEENQGEDIPVPIETYGDVVVGGTFDRLHGAHRTLLNICCLLANRRFVIGVCDQELLKSRSHK